MTDTEKPADGSEERTRIRRPQIEYSSPKAFAKSFAARWRSVWTKRFILSLLAGQVVSLCITCTSVTTTELVNRGWLLSTTQNFFTCVVLIWAILSCGCVAKYIFGTGTFHCFSLIRLTRYTNVSIHIHLMNHIPLIYNRVDGFSGWGRLIKKDGIKCTWIACSYTRSTCHFRLIANFADFLLAACDVEGNFLAVYVRGHFRRNWEIISKQNFRPFNTLISCRVCCLTRKLNQ